MALNVVTLTNALRVFMDPPDENGPGYDEFVIHDPEVFDPVLFPTQEAKMEEFKRRMKEEPEFLAEQWSAAYDTYMVQLTSPGVAATSAVSKAAMKLIMEEFFSLPDTIDLTGGIDALPPPLQAIVAPILGFFPLANFPNPAKLSGAVVLGLAMVAYCNALQFPGFNGPPNVPTTATPPAGPNFAPMLLATVAPGGNLAACVAMATIVDAWTRTNSRTPGAGPPEVFFA